MTKPGFVVAILLALTLPASAEDLRSANYMLPGCKAYVDRDVSTRPLIELGQHLLPMFLSTPLQPMMPDATLGKRVTNPPCQKEELSPAVTGLSSERSSLPRLIPPSTLSAARIRNPSFGIPRPNPSAMHLIPSP
jgi:hypothetical protein